MCTQTRRTARKQSRWGKKHCRNLSRCKFEVRSMGHRLACVPMLEEDGNTSMVEMILVSCGFCDSFLQN
jgi:hypothetical protein